ncbi:MAG: methyl-accepting chemotaxis protein [Treponema sp.]|jgi:methyl-accepting chemotaxis protein|nr:methyl-accepting chemotaxis protein [Treponema sp.]
MNNSNTGKSFLFSLIAGAGVCAAAAVSLGVQIHLAGNISADAAGIQAFKGLLLWGGIINIALFVLGFVILLFRNRALSGKLDTLSGLVRPLAEKNFSALLQIPESKSGAEKAADEIELIESLRSLGKLFESLKTMAGRSAEMGNVLRDDGNERDAVLKHLGELTDKIAGQFFEIESTVDQGIESLGGIEGYLTTLNENSGNQAALLLETESKLTQSSDLSKSAAARIHESAGKAELLREEIGAEEEQAQEVNDLVRNIAREVEGISEMTAIINQISEQTNMLSMNAAIESAHAGQAGKGFAVVAEEIRKLAESTRENAARIHEEVLSINKNTQGALKASESSFGTFNTLTARISELAKELAEISSSASETNGVNSDILAFFREFSSSNLRLRDGGVDSIAHSHSFRGSLEMIKSLSDTTRAEIKEIHSGTAEVLDNIRNTQDRIINGLNEAGEISNIIPGKPVVLHAGEITAVSKTLDDDSKGYSDSREVTVKQPPRTIF